jgi:hypothetical protein
MALAQRCQYTPAAPKVPVAAIARAPALATLPAAAQCLSGSHRTGGSGNMSLPQPKILQAAHGSSRAAANMRSVGLILSHTRRNGYRHVRRGDGLTHKD